MISKKPKVSIGLPVYNGENFLREAIDSILSQTFEDFELIVSDNASTDSTEEICKHYVALDNRVKYSRNEENLGASRNYNKVFKLASGEYFKWAAHDDLCHPKLLEKCVSVLDSDPSVVLAYPKCNKVDELGNEIEKTVFISNDLASPHFSKRLEEVMLKGSWLVIFGLIRTDTLSKTPLFGSFGMNDWILLFELALFGTFQEVPELLFSHRVHSSQFTKSIWKSKSPRAFETVNWFDTNKGTQSSFPYWRRAYETFVSSWRVPLTLKERLICIFIICKWMLRTRNRLAKDVAGNIRDFWLRNKNDSPA